MFSAIFTKGKNFCGFQFASRKNKALMNSGLLFKERIGSKRIKFLNLLRRDTKMKKSRVAPPKRIPIHPIEGGRVEQWCWINFQHWSVLLTWIIVGQGPTGLAVGVVGGCLDISLLSIISLFILPIHETA